MTLEELKTRVIFQVNADADDLSDYEPHLTGYINRGYNLLLFALVKRRLPSADFPELSKDEDTPKIPAWRVAESGGGHCHAHQRGPDWFTATATRRSRIGGRRTCTPFRKSRQSARPLPADTALTTAQERLWRGARFPRSFTMCIQRQRR